MSEDPNEVVYLALPGDHQPVVTIRSMFWYWVDEMHYTIMVGDLPPNPYQQYGYHTALADGTWEFTQTFPTFDWNLVINSDTDVVHYKGHWDSDHVVTPATIGAASQASLDVVSATLTTVSSVASMAAIAAEAANASVATLPAAMKMEVVTATLGAGGTLNATFAKSYPTERYCVPIINWNGNVQLTAVLDTPSATGVTVTGKKSVNAVIALAPFTDCEAGDVVKFLVIGR